MPSPTFKNNPPTTQIPKRYIQCRGRARRPGSRLLLMVPLAGDAGNSRARQALLRLERWGHVRAAAVRGRRLLDAVPCRRWCLAFRRWGLPPAAAATSLSRACCASSQSARIGGKQPPTSPNLP
jgi:hypothetical protein